MYLKSISVRNFRNHLKTRIEFGSGTNILLGDNGQGKTNIIEAISYLCLTKSFYSVNDENVVNFGESFFEVEGTFVSGSQTEINVRVAYDKVLGRKVYLINRQSVQPLSSVIGRFPVVICSPFHSEITTGSPESRRKFVDIVISQSNSKYLTTLLNYRSVVKNRNKVLLNAKLTGSNPESLLEPWNEQLVKYGSEILFWRHNFIEEFRDYIISSYKELVRSNESPDIEYYSSLAGIMNCKSAQDIQELFFSKILERRQDELAIGSTIIGPHRDEFILKINGYEVRKYASQGQHKTFLLALKLAEFFYLKERCKEIPILLLDDIFSELDQHRASELLVFVRTLSQTFITSTLIDVFKGAIEFCDQNRIISICNGEVINQSEVVIS